jgi:hypothetical protein
MSRILTDSTLSMPLIENENLVGFGENKNCELFV